MDIYQIISNYFVAGAIFKPDGSGFRCIKTAPIIRWMVGFPLWHIEQFCDAKDWSLQLIDSMPELLYPNPLNF